jgi:LPS-assembly lipoprotein
MSKTFRSRYLVHAAVLGMVLGLGGCFQPMYAPTSGRDVVGEARGVAITPIPGMVGHYLENELRFALNGSGEPATPRYNLQITVNERTQTPLIDTVTGRATANSIYTTAQYKLVPVGATEPITAGTVVSLASYDRTSQRFANIRAARDAEIRNAKALAQDIRTRIVADLATRLPK